MDGAIVVIDEEHNVEGVCREAGSLELSLVDIVYIALDLCRLSQRLTYRWVITRSISSHRQDLIGPLVPKGVI